MDGPRGFEPPAKSVWFDMENKTEHVLEPAQRAPADSGAGFLWVDIELSQPADAAPLVERGYLPASVAEDDRAAGEVSWTLEADRVHLTLAGGRLEGSSVTLDRRHIVISQGVVASVHRGLPEQFDRVRQRYRDAFASFAETHGFLLFELCGLLVDDLQGVVRDLGYRIDELRLAPAKPAPTAGGDVGSELLVSVLLVRHILVRTRDLLMELSSRRVALVPETTQPYLRDMAGRLDGHVGDLAFSRDVLSEAMRAAPAEAQSPQPSLAPDPAPARPRRPAPARPPLRFLSLGGFRVLRGGEAIPDENFGSGRARWLLGAVLCARRSVSRDELYGWFWPDLETERAERALEVAVTDLARALEPEREDGGSGVVLAESGGFRVQLSEGDTWDVEEVLAEAARASEVHDPEERARSLAALLEDCAAPLYPEWPYAEWTTDLRRECERATRAIRASLAESLLAGDRPSDALAHFEALLDDDPEQESWHRGIMRCHAAAGERALALRRFHTCRSVLRQSQGVDPSPETQALYLDLLREDSG